MFTVSQRLGRHTYSIVRFLVRLLVVVLLLIVIAFVFLRLYGVPDPLLREVVRRFNASGVLIDIESVRLTLRGWRASNVSYYSRHPDDLEPVIHASEVLFKRAMLPDGTHSDRLNFDVHARGVELSPSVEWGIEVPADSPFKMIDSARVSVSFLPDQIHLSDGSLHWMGIDFQVNGSFLKKVSTTDVPEAAAEEEEEVRPVAPALLSENAIRRVERWFKSLELDGAARVDIAFVIDAGNYADSTMSCSASINDFIFKDVAFSRAELSCSYSYPHVVLRQASLQKDNQTFHVEGAYELDTQLAQVSVSNDIQSRRLLLLLPQDVLRTLTGIELGFETLPIGDISFGPAVPLELLNSISGSFSVRNARYHNLEIESVSGNVTRENNRLNFTELNGVVGGQEDRVEELGSCMIGGPVKGEVFWDSGKHEYGVIAEGSFDPNLLLEPLAFSKVATNIIRRFRFGSQPPQARVELGQNYSMRHTFFITIHGSGLDVFFQDVPFTSVNTSVAYKQGVLTIDPVVAKQGADFVKGAAALDFANDIVTFDAMGSISPEAMEDVIYPPVNVFGDKVKISGKRKITARGCVDWRHMQATDFEATVEADRCEVPVGVLDGLTASVTGRGSSILIHDAEFSMYGGEGSGDLTLQLDPHKQGVPYTIDLELTDVDVSKLLQFLRPYHKYGISGKLSAVAHVDSDFTCNLFEVANGAGRIDVKDGQLADLPLFKGFSKVMRKLIPSFRVFSINSLSGDFEIKEGVISSENAYFDGDLLSAKGQGKYSGTSGFDAYVQAQVFSDNPLSKVFRVITDPLFKFFEFRLEGSLSDPSWHLDKFSGESERRSSID